MQEENPDGPMMPTDENYNGALIHHQSILRNKRCLLAYTYGSSSSPDTSLLGVLEHQESGLLLIWWNRAVNCDANVVKWHCFKFVGLRNGLIWWTWWMFVSTFVLTVIQCSKIWYCKRGFCGPGTTVHIGCNASDGSLVLSFLRISKGGCTLLKRNLSKVTRM